MTTRRNILKGSVGVLGAMLASACSGAQRTAQSAFATTAGVILGNLDAVLGGLVSVVPAGSSILVDISDARTAVTAAESILTIYNNALTTSNTTECSALGTAVSAAVNASLVVLRSLIAAGVSISDTTLVAIEGAGTIVDQVAVVVCSLIPSTNDAGVDGGTNVGAPFVNLARSAVIRTRFEALNLHWVQIPANLQCHCLDR